MEQGRLKVRDLITLAIFSVLFLVIYFAVATLMWLSVVLYPFCVALAMMPCGVVWAYLRVKVPKRFGILIQAALLAVIIFFLGSGWFASVGLICGGLLAELLSAVGRYRSFRWNTLGYAVFSVLNNLGVYAIILLARDYYLDFSIQSGMDPTHMNRLVNLMSGPLVLLTCALAALGAILGMLLGRLMLKKHFVKAGMV
jgi:energy-coupling factor transport system substrate-specific component